MVRCSLCDRFTHYSNRAHYTAITSGDRSITYVNSHRLIGLPVSNDTTIGAAGCAVYRHVYLRTLIHISLKPSSKTLITDSQYNFMHNTVTSILIDAHQKNCFRISDYTSTLKWVSYPNSPSILIGVRTKDHRTKDHRT